MVATPEQKLHLLAYSDAPDAAGAEKSLGVLLAALDPSWDVTIVATNPEVLTYLGSFRPTAERVLLSPVGGRADVRAVLAHLKTFARRRGAVAHLNLRQPWSCQYALVAARVCGVPHVSVHHLALGPVRWSQAALVRFVGRRSDACVAVSRSTAREIEHLWRLPPGRVEVVHNGLPPLGRRCLPSHSSRRAPVIGLVGRLVEDKGFDVALRALVESREVDAVVVGDGEQRRNLETLAASLDVADRVDFVGWHPHPQELMAEWSAVVVPSRRDFLPLVVMEAMMAGVPVIATDVGGLPEMIADSVTGLLIPPDDPGALSGAIKRLVGDPTFAEQLAAAAHAYAHRHFDVQQMAARYSEIYRRLAT